MKDILTELYNSFEKMLLRFKLLFSLLKLKYK